jgi:hypothetical protein
MTNRPTCPDHADLILAARDYLRQHEKHPLRIVRDGRTHWSWRAPNTDDPDRCHTLPIYAFARLISRDCGANHRFRSTSAAREAAVVAVAGAMAAGWEPGVLVEADGQGVG